MKIKGPQIQNTQCTPNKRIMMKTKLKHIRIKLYKKKRKSYKAMKKWVINNM